MSKFVRFLLPGVPSHADAYRPSRFRGRALEICGHNFARALVLEAFINKISSFADAEVATWRVAVVGGSKADPECKFIEARVREIISIGVSDSEIQLDLNDCPPAWTPKKFDLVICSQVLEHIWNHKNFFDNITQLLAATGHAWVAAPMANRFHSSPEYYSAGFAMEYLAKNLQNHGVEVLDGGQIGSRRLFEATLTTDTWLSYKGNRYPSIFGFQEYPRMYKLGLRLRWFFRMIGFHFLSGQIRHDSRYAVESWVWARRN